MVLSVQFIAKVYAAAYTLSSSTTEIQITYGMIFADLNGDGTLDEIAGNSGFTGIIDPYSNDGSGVFTHQTAFGYSLSSFAAGDIDNDGDLDIVQGQAGNSSIHTFRNVGSFSFTESYNDMFAGGTAYNIALTDVDNDGDLDIMVGNNNAYARQVYINDGHGNYADVASTLPGFAQASENAMQPADFNSDGYMDIAFVGRTGRFEVYKNSGTGAFIESYGVAASLVNTLAVGDFDGDGDIDVVVTNAADNIWVYKNNGDGTSFTAGTSVASGFTSVETIAAGDIDNDGDLDIIIGSGPYGQGVKVFVNDGTGVFSASGSPSETSDYTSAIAIGDIDGDGDLDYSRGNSNNGEVNRRYKNDQAATLANTAPTAPSNFTAVKISDNGSTATVRLSWGSGSDTITPTKMLQYQLRVGTGSNTHNIISGRTASPNWVTRVMPNGQSRTMLLKNIPCNKTFYWSAATVDTGFMSTWATEETFDLDAACTLTGGGGGLASTPSTGGGLPAWWFRNSTASLDSAPAEDHKATITISAFHDITRNKIKDKNESTLTGNLSFTASGRTTLGLAIHETQTLSTNGETTFSLPPSDSRGYWIITDTGSSLFQDFEPTTPTLTGSFVLRSNQEKSLYFGFVRNDLLSYNPCLTIGSPTASPVNTDAGHLLARLQNSFGESILTDLTLSGSLIDRRNFFSALQRTHCIPLETSQEKLIQGLKKIAPRNLILPLIDLPIDLRLPDAALLYSLLTQNISVERPTLKGPAADLSSPITRRETVQAIFDALKVPTHKIILTGSSLPLDLKKDDPLVSPFLTLRSFNILPDSFLKTLGPSQGINPTEAATLLARTAFTAGKISLLPPVLDKSIKQPLKAAAPTETFLTLFPPLTIPPCLQTIEKRSKEFSFRNILPGDPLSSDISTLLTKATENEDKKLMWLLTGTSRPTEFGIARGSSILDLDESPALLDVIRTLLILSCSPPDTPTTATTKIFNGSLFTKIPRDKISNLPRDNSFASRTLYAAEDHQKEFELSFFSFAPDLLSQETKPPATPLNLKEASGLLASTLLRMAVLQEFITPQEAEGQASILRQTIAEELLGNTLDWREENILTKTPFTRRMLIQFLSTVLEQRTTQTTSTSEPISLGEIWWERVK